MASDRWQLWPCMVITLQRLWQATAEDSGVVWVYNDGLRLAPMPVLAAATRHTFFLQRLHERCLSVPPARVVSATHTYTQWLTAAGALYVLPAV